MFECVSSSNEVRTFETYEEAYRFVMREGDRSRLWSLDEVEAPCEEYPGEVTDPWDSETNRAIAQHYRSA